MNLEFLLATFLCLGTSVIWLIIGYFQWKGGSYYWKLDQWGRRIERVEDGKRIPYLKTPAIKMFIVHLIAGGVVYALIASDYWDIWFQ